MEGVTYEQFVDVCNHWGYSTEEGYKAMCFILNILGHNFYNHVDYVEEVSHTDAFNYFVETEKGKALILLDLYEKLNSRIFNMLEKEECQMKNDKSTEAVCEFLPADYEEDCE